MNLLVRPHPGLRLHALDIGLPEVAVLQIPHPRAVAAPPAVIMPIAIRQIPDRHGLPLAEHAPFFLPDPLLPDGGEAFLP